MNMVNHGEWKKLKKKHVGSVYEWYEWMKEKNNKYFALQLPQHMYSNVTEKLIEEKKTQIETIQNKTKIEKNRQIRNRKTDFRW